MKLASLRSRSVTKTTSLLVTAGFVAWSATHVAELIWHVAAPDSGVSASGVISDVQFDRLQQPSASQSVDLARLQSVFVFSPAGQVNSTISAADSAVQAADTRLALTLKAAIASSDVSRSRAIIASADVQEVYQPGESLLNTPGNVVLQEIHQTYVLLDNNGRIETLRMDEAVPSALTVAETSQVANQRAGIVADPASLPAGIAASSVFTDLVRIQPMFEPADSARAGALRGLQIRHGSRQDFLAAVGLQQGDVITAVDGQQLDVAADLPALMAQLSSQQSVSLQVLRDQTPLTVELDRSRW